MGSKALEKSAGIGPKSDALGRMRRQLLAVAVSSVTTWQLSMT